MSPTECEYVDPQQRLLLESVWEALEDGGINPQTLVGTLTGVYTGAWNLDYKDLLQNAEENNNINFRLYMGNSFGTREPKLQLDQFKNLVIRYKEIICFITYFKYFQ